MATYTEIATDFNANSTAIAAATSGLTASEILGIADLCTILARDKGLGLAPLLKSTTAKANIVPE